MLGDDGFGLAGKARLGRTGNGMIRQGDSRRVCNGCMHLGRAGTCLEPIKAGLIPVIDGFGIVWPPAGYSAKCKAFVPLQWGVAA